MKIWNMEEAAAMTALPDTRLESDGHEGILDLRPVDGPRRHGLRHRHAHLERPRFHVFRVIDGDHGDFRVGFKF
jgi:hypothetical protein